MALTRKLMKSMGIEDEKIDQIIEAHVETVDALKEERDAFRADSERLAEVEKELQAFRDAPSGDEYREKYEAERDAFEAYKAEIAAKDAERAKAGLYRGVLRDAGIDEKRLDSVMRVTDLTGIEVVDGEIADRDKEVEAARKEWADFIPSITAKAATVDNPPANAGGSEKEPKDLAEAMRMKMMKE